MPAVLMSNEAGALAREAGKEPERTWSAFALGKVTASCGADQLHPVDRDMVLDLRFRSLMTCLPGDGGHDALSGRVAGTAANDQSAASVEVSPDLMFLF